MLLQKMPQAQIESIAENQLVELRQTGRLSYERYADADPTPKHPHGAYGKVILLCASGMIIRDSYRSRLLGLPLRVVLDTACTCMTSAHDAHMCVEATQEPCWLQAAPAAPPDPNASRAEREARRLGITSHPDTAAGPGRSPGQPSAANAAACFEALDRAVASNSGNSGLPGDAGKAASGKGLASGQGHKDVVSSARSGGKSSFLFGAALGVKKKPAVAPAAASPASAAAVPAAGGEQGWSVPARSAADASEPLRHPAAAAPGGAATSKKQRAQQTSSSNGDRDGHDSGGGSGGAAQAATPPAFISQLAAGQPPQVDCSAVLCSTSHDSLPLLAHAPHACCIPPAIHVTIALPRTRQMRCHPADSDVVHLHKARRQPVPQQQPRAQANRAGAAGAAGALGPSPSSPQMHPPTTNQAHRQQAAARKQQRPTACRLAANPLCTRWHTPQAVPQPQQQQRRQKRRRHQQQHQLWHRPRLLMRSGLMQTHWQRSC